MKATRSVTQEKRSSAQKGKTSSPKIKRKNLKELEVGTSEDVPTNIAFDASCKELRFSWHSFAEKIYCINPYPNGITLSVHRNEAAKSVAEVEAGTAPEKYRPSQFHLRFRDTKNFQLPSGKYFLYRENFSDSLEKVLSHIRERNEQASSLIYFGMVTDPFRSFQKKFNVTMTCLQLLEKYNPGFVVVQTRSPMVIAGLPTLKSLGKNVVVAMPVETHLDHLIARYTPEQPKISQRLLAADGLRKQGIRVNLMASPLLPYGDMYRDAWDLAEVLDKYSDYISLGCLAGGTASEEAQLKTLSIANKLISDGQYRWLRPRCYRALYHALREIAPEKLCLPVSSGAKPEQLSIFEAA